MTIFSAADDRAMDDWQPGRPTRARHIATLAFCSAAAVAYLSRNCLGVFAADDRFQEEINASREQLSLAMSSFLAAYAVAQIPAGWLGHRFGSRIVLTVFVVLWSVCIALMGLAPGLVALCAVQAALGAAQAGVFPNAARSIADWIPSGRRAFVCGLMAACMSVGGAIATGLTGWLVGAGISWRAIAALYALPGLLWAVWFWYWFRDQPADHAGVNAAELALIRAPAGPGPRTGSDDLSNDDGDPAATAQSPSPDSARPVEAVAIPWLAMARSRALWLINGQQFFRAAGYIFFATWFPTFLKETRGVSVAGAGLLASLPLLAVVAGSSIGGGLTDWLLHRTGSRRFSRQFVSAGCLATCAVLILAARWANTTGTAMSLITLGSFFAAVAGPCSYAQTIDLAGRQVPIVFSVMNMAGNFGAAVSPPVVTWVVTVTGSWPGVLILFSLIYLAAAVCWLLLDPDRSLDGSGFESNRDSSSH